MEQSQQPAHRVNSRSEGEKGSAQLFDLEGGGDDAILGRHVLVRAALQQLRHQQRAAAVCVRQRACTAYKNARTHSCETQWYGADDTEGPPLDTSALSAAKIKLCSSLLPLLPFRLPRDAAAPLPPDATPRRLPWGLSGPVPRWAVAGGDDIDARPVAQLTVACTVANKSLLTG